MTTHGASAPRLFFLGRVTWPGPVPPRPLLQPPLTGATRPSFGWTLKQQRNPALHPAHQVAPDHLNLMGGQPNA